MRSPFYIMVLLAWSTVFGQSPAGATAYANPLGFSYTISSNWEVVNTADTLSVTKKDKEPEATSGAEKKGMECLGAPLTARRGDPASVIVEVLIPFDCFGQTFTENELPGFGAGVAAGMKQSVDMSNPVETTYALGSHHLWAQRSQGNLKGKPESKYTIEVACGVLKKAAVCWMVMAANDAALTDFENGAVTLEDDPPVALVPAATFKQ